MQIRERSELISEGATAFTLLSSIPVAYAKHQVDAFVALNAVAGVGLALVVLRGIVLTRRHHDADSTGANLVGVFGGLAAIVEGIHKLHSAQFTFGHKHFAFGITAICTGLLTAALALFAERLEHRRALTLSSDGVRMRLNKFRRFDAPWADIAELRIGATEAKLVSASGNARVVPLRRLVNRDEVTEALTDAASARGVKITRDR
jgi:hypothetical protein